MSHIVNNKNDLYILKDLFSSLDINNISNDGLSRILEVLLPRDENDELLVSYRIMNKLGHAATFYPQSNSILVSIFKLNELVKKNRVSLGEYYDIKDLSALDEYFLMFVITHEIEHGYQYLMGNDKVDSPCCLVREGYKRIFDLFMRNQSIIPRPIKEMRRILSEYLYKMNENFYVLERNANIESLDLLCQYALLNNNEEAYKMFDDMKNTFAIIGYKDNNNGSFSETYQKILMEDKYDKFDKNYDLSIEDCIRYGLPISEEERIKVLRLGTKKNGK